ncbi:MAG: serine/threonine protein kinase [Richelia sp. RM2_1_2]|nr:serine/threonine protein kinase [Richelia sp. SM1_7_0]NJN07151.1 serine/threonine protein kinase [Richelia sp. RM1_1_1]NJO31219.1 serine/threonine protein kinase [Richelia sp. SL_2_1]NJO57842.1 serine/threonine protein kinase [Richelia sp. RM2_1_2]
MSEEINSGTLINNRYLIDKTLGRGGFGRTYLALDIHRFKEPCVLKEFLPNTNNAKVISKSKELFEREAKVLYQIQHSQIPQFLALLTHNQQLFIVQEYINGKTYLQILEERLAKTGKPFSEPEVKEWLLNMLPVLEYIHSCNIIHRDISLENVMLPDNGSKPVLIDFGVVKEKFNQIFVTDSSSEQYCTKASVVGKIGYSPPEQLRLGQCYPSSDIYALAVCAVILLTGKMPYLLIDESLNWQWQKSVNISGYLAKILEKMLAELPIKRYQSAKEVIIELENSCNYNINVSDSDLKPKISLGGIISSLLPKQTDNKKKLKADEELSFEKLGQTPVSLNPQFVDYCQQQLTSFVGPLASVVMQQTLDENPDIASKEFIEVLANKIPNVQRAEDFRNHIQLLKEFKLEKTPKLNESSLNLIKSPAISHPDFLDHCRRELTSFVGPFASVVIRDTLEECPHFTPKQLVESLVAGIPNQKKAKEFEKRILKGRE